MAISRKKKEELLEEYIEKIKQSQGMVFTDYRALTVGQLTDIRKDIRPLNSNLQVVKNRILALALKEAGLSLPDEWLDGPLAISFCNDEVPPVAKVLTKAANDLEPFKIKGGVLGESVLSMDQVNAIADLPSREVLLAQVLGTINAPATRTAGVIAGGIRQILNVLQAYVDKLGEGAGMEPAAEPA